MTWAAPESDLRTKLDDNIKDKMNYRKKVFGDVNGENVFFRTFEFRRVTDFTASDFPFGVWINGVLQSASAVKNDFLDSGDFELSSAPDSGSLIEASYYNQWFLDSEIVEFLRLASNFMGLGDIYQNIQGGLQPATLAYATGEAYDKLALRWSRRMSEMYLVQDAIEKDRFTLADTYKKWADQNRKMAMNLRDDFYSRSGQAEIPASGSIVGHVRNLVTSR